MMGTTCTGRAGRRVRYYQGCIVMKGGGRWCRNDYIKRGYTVILARIILKQESGGVGILDHIKARANDVESLLITPCKPTYVVAFSPSGLRCIAERRNVFAYRPNLLVTRETLFRAFSPDLIHINPTTGTLRLLVINVHKCEITSVYVLFYSLMHLQL
jgi:hypothetical protein